MKFIKLIRSNCGKNHLHCLLSIAFLCFYLVAQFFQMRVGLADNGDFFRLQFWFSSAPVHFSANFPDPANSEEWNRRFFHYWVQLWKLDFPDTRDRVLSSTLLLILPGVWLNQLVYSKENLYLLFVSVTPRLGGLFFLLLVYYWIGRYARQPVLHDLVLGLPLVWLLSTTDIIAYYGSFFQETGSLIFLLALLAVAVYLRRSPPSWAGFGLYCAAVVLLATTKSSQIYWPILAAPLGYSSIPPAARRSVRGLAIALAVIFPTLAAAWLPAVPMEKPYNQYNALFAGVLLLSRDPQRQLERIQLDEFQVCVGVDSYSPAGDACLQRLRGRITYRQTIEVLLAEPTIVLRQFDLIGRVLYQFSSDTMGKFAYGVPTPDWYPFFNLPSRLIATFGPRAVGLPLFSIAAAFLFILARRWSGIAGDLAVCGLLLLSAMWVDMYIQILGDGQRDLLKHLFLSNICFILAFIASTNIALLLAWSGLRGLWRKTRYSCHLHSFFSSQSTPK